MGGLNEDPYPSIPFRLALPPEPAKEAPKKPVSVTSRCKVSVLVRIRPLQACSEGSGKRSDNLIYPELWDEDIITISRPCSDGREKLQCFSSVLGPTQSQQDVFESSGARLLDAFLSGEDCALLAYGQTGSGKSHTVFGEWEKAYRSRKNSTDDKGSNKDGRIGDLKGSIICDQMGVLPRFLLLALSRLPEGSTLTACAVEVYCENIRDLLNDQQQVRIESASISGGSRATERKKAQPKPKGTGKAKKGSRSVPDVPKKQQQKIFKMTGQQSLVLQSAADVMKLISSVQSAREQARHGLNEQSSRSHCVIQVCLRATASQGKRKAQPITMTFVDLAGSERLKKSLSEGQRMREAVDVNKSLTILGRCVRGLADASSDNPSSDSTFLPIRDSSLTMLLCKVLQGGRCCMIVTVAQDTEHGDETLASLEFGRSAALVQTAVVSTAKSIASNVDNAHACRDDND